jgi:signal transduction histidine kinase
VSDVQSATFDLTQLPTVRGVLGECISQTTFHSAFLVVLRTRGKRKLLSLLARYPEGEPETRSTNRAFRLTVHAAVESGRTLLCIKRPTRGRSGAGSPEVLMAVPVIVDRRRVWGALVGVGQLSSPGAAAVTTMERLAQQLGDLLSPEHERPHSDEPSGDRDEERSPLPVGIPQDVLLHELRAPLGAAAYALDVLLRAHGSPGEAEDAHLLQTAQFGVAHAQSIVRWASQVRAIAVGSTRPTIAAISIRDAIDRSLALLPTARARVRLEVAEDLVPVAADPLWLTQTLTNLLENAVKYTRLPDLAVVSANQVTPERVRISVTAFGSSISRDEQQVIFHPYVRGAPSDDLTSRGLGLSIARHLVTTMGGDLWAESDGSTHTTLLLTLPVAQP